MKLNEGDTIGDWIVEGPLGEGGMGAVYRVHSVLSGELKAALKTLKPHEVGQGRERFAVELQALARLTHPSIVRVLGGGEDSQRNLLYLVMELLEGETLGDRIKRGPLPADDAAALFRAVGEGLAFAHSKGIFHRDVKPANIMLVPDAGPRLIDFGIAKEKGGQQLTQAGTVAGTMAYIAPEVFQSDDPDAAAADVYSLGLTLHEALTGSSVYGNEGTTSGAPPSPIPPSASRPPRSSSPRCRRPPPPAASAPAPTSRPPPCRSARRWSRRRSKKPPWWRQRRQIRLLRPRPHPPPAAAAAPARPRWASA